MVYINFTSLLNSVGGVGSVVHWFVVGVRQTLTLVVWVTWAHKVFARLKKMTGVEILVWIKPIIYALL